jgi:hypothetical protein
MLICEKCGENGASDWGNMYDIGIICYRCLQADEEDGIWDDLVDENGDSIEGLKNRK